MDDGTDLGERILRLPDVKAKTGLSRSSIYQRMRAKTFPPAVMITEYAVGWKLSDIDRWISQLPERRPHFNAKSM